MNRYQLTRTDSGLTAIVAAEDEYEARLTAQTGGVNRGRAGRAWMSEAVTVSLLEVCTPDLEPHVVGSAQWGAW